MSNLLTEKKAIELVIAYECKRLNIKDAKEIKKAKKGTGYDLVSKDRRKIEVKGTKQKEFNKGLRLNSEQEIKFCTDGGYIYRVTDVFGKKPKLYILKCKKEYLSIKKWATCSVPQDEQGNAIEL